VLINHSETQTAGCVYDSMKSNPYAHIDFNKIKIANHVHDKLEIVKYYQYCHTCIAGTNKFFSYFSTLFPFCRFKRFLSFLGYYSIMSIPTPNSTLKINLTKIICKKPSNLMVHEFKHLIYAQYQS